MSSPAAWHPDPTGRHQHRYWDGERWTDHVADDGVATLDALPEAATPSEDGPATPVDDRPAGDDGRAAAPAPPAAEERIADDRSGLGQTPAPTGPAWGGAPSSTGPAWGDAGSPVPSSGLATGALVVGILSLPLLIVFGLGAVAGVIAVVMGVVALRRTGRGEASGRGLAIGGIVTGGISILLGALILLALIAFGFGFAGEMQACIEETGSQAVCQERLQRQLTERFLDR